MHKIEIIHVNIDPRQSSISENITETTFNNKCIRRFIMNQVQSTLSTAHFT